ncbi:MAG TPA: helix-turn-helix domain-containing protein [Vicinamibacterales bacterium]|nr:helix-turn-helix domain-containing protein [Vicinamibacterales bacterium]
MTGPDSAVAAPALPLRPFVSHYAGSRMRDLPPGQHAGLPSRHIDLIVSLARPIEIARMPGTQSPGAYRAFVAGLQQAPALVRMSGDLDCLHVFLKPAAARALLGISGRAVASQVVHLADIDGAMCDELIDRLSVDDNWLQRFAAVDRMLLRRLRPVTMSHDMVWAWRSLALSHGCLPVHELARDIGFSRRHFGERFTSEFGIAPKAAARVFRFERACRLFLRSPHRIADVAMASGFYDQAHMVREWHALAGCTPREWIVGQLPFLQDYEIGGGHD